MTLDRAACPPHALFLDLDGTLVDSRLDIAASCNAALVAHGFPPIEPPARIAEMVGDGARALVARALAAGRAGVTGEVIDAVLRAFEAHYAAHPCVHTVVLPGASDVLACGVPCAVLTNKPRSVATLVLEQLDLAPHLAAVWAADGRLKPAPDGVLALAATLGVDPRAVWVIGDGPQDVGAGKAAGAFTVAVHGIASWDAVLAARPDAVAGSLGEVAAMVRSAGVPLSRVT